MPINKRFVKALENGDLAELQLIPKSDLHNHAIFGTKRSNIEKWAGCIIPEPSIFTTLDEMADYANTTIVKHIASVEGIEFVFKSAINDAIEDGVTLLEMSIDSLIISFYHTGVRGMTAYLNKIQTENPEITFKPELGISRDHHYEEIEQIAIECVESGAFLSIDLYGNENAAPSERYKSLYSRAKNAGMKLKAHVGEFGPAESIRETVENLELDEVQHGITAAESPEIMRWLACNKISLNICPTSNVNLSRVQDIRSHPIKMLCDYGIPVTINTDDLTIFNQSVSEEYLNLFQAGVFSAVELDEIRQNSLRI